MVDSIHSYLGKCIYRYIDAYYAQVSWVDGGKSPPSIHVSIHLHSIHLSNQLCIRPFMYSSIHTYIHPITHTYILTITRCSPTFSRYEGFTMLPDGRILLAARVTNTTNNEADAQGAVYILHPSSITEEAVLPLFPQEPEKHDHEEEMVSDENGGEEVKLEGGMEQPLAVEADPVGIEGPAQSKAEDEEVVLLPPIVGEENGQGNAPSLEVSGSNEVTQAPSSAPAAPEIEEAFSSNTALRHTSKATGIKTEKKQVPQRKVSQASKKSLNVPMSRESLDKSLGKSLKPPKAGNPGRRKSSLKQKEPPPLEEPAPPVFVPRPRPYIPKLKMSRVEDVMFYAGVPQPVPLDPLTACRRNYHRALYTYEEGDKSLILECLPLTRTITSNPFTGRVVVGFCGADPKGLLCSFGILDFNTEASCSLRPIMGGFSECLAIDAYDNVITRSGRKDGKLRILWANGSHGWGKILLREAALVDLPSSPKGEEKEMGKTKNMGLKMIKEMQTLRQDTQVQDVSGLLSLVISFLVISWECFILTCEHVGKSFFSFIVNLPLLMTKPTGLIENRKG